MTTETGAFATSTLACDMERAQTASLMLQLVRQGAELVSIWLRRARSRRDLGELSGDLLLDMGVSRDQASSEATKPFWRA